MLLSPIASQDSNEELARLLSISRAYKVSKCLNLAGKLGVFTLCSQATPKGGLTADEVAVALGLQRGPGFRGVSDLLDLLVSINTLQREGDGVTARYLPHPSNAKFLVGGSSDYMGGLLALSNDRSSVLFDYLEHVLRDGEVPPEAHARVGEMVSTFNGTAQVGMGAENFALGMLGASLGNFRLLAERFDFSRYTSVVDIGGSTGAACVAICQRHPHMTGTTCDLPAVRPVAEHYVEQQGMQGRVKVVDLDFFSPDPFPPADVILMGMILHDWGEDKKRQLVAKAYAALPPGGAFILVDTLIDDARRTATTGLAMSIDMLLEFGKENSFDYSFKEFTSWALEAGFTSTCSMPLVGPTAAAVAIK